MSWIAPVTNLVGNIFTGIFGFKKAQSDVVLDSLKTFDAISDSDKAYFAASAASIQSVYTNGSWLEKNWRPSLMWVCISILISRWFFGFNPPGLTPYEVEQMYNMIYIGLCGYVPLRSIDKWMQGFQIGSILKNFITKRLL